MVCSGALCDVFLFCILSLFLIKDMENILKLHWLIFGYSPDTSSPLSIVIVNSKHGVTLLIIYNYVLLDEVEDLLSFKL